jgi:hypothetical protein
MFFDFLTVFGAVRASKFEGKRLLKRLTKSKKKERDETLSLAVRYP